MFCVFFLITDKLFFDEKFNWIKKAVKYIGMRWTEILADTFSVSYKLWHAKHGQLPEWKYKSLSTECIVYYIYPPQPHLSTVPVIFPNRPLI